jgi:copper/silver efflux system protein
VRACGTLFTFPFSRQHVPVLWSTGAGSDVMQRIGVPMIGSMVSLAALTLTVIPAV